MKNNGIQFKMINPLLEAKFEKAASPRKYVHVCTLIGCTQEPKI